MARDVTGVEMTRHPGGPRELLPALGSVQQGRRDKFRAELQATNRHLHKEVATPAATDRRA